MNCWVKLMLFLDIYSPLNSYFRNSHLYDLNVVRATKNHSLILLEHLLTFQPATFPQRTNKLTFKTKTFDNEIAYNFKLDWQDLYKFQPNWRQLYQVFSNYLPLALVLKSQTPFIVSFFVAKLKKTDAWPVYVRASCFSFLRDLSPAQFASEVINFWMWHGATFWFE